MSFLLDTNLVSEWTKPSPNPGVIAWTDGVGEDETFLSVVTIAELRRGVDRLAPGARRKRFEEWLREELLPRFEGRVLPINIEIADRCGGIIAHHQAVGRRIEAMDAFIAATAVCFGLTLVTRNASDFEVSVPAIHNPWT